MPTLVIVGAQWGDEAKGKMVDLLGAEADMVVRFAGGNNAGHTVIVGEEVFKFHLLPAGILHPECMAVLGGGMVIAPKALLGEIDSLIERGYAVENLAISPAAHVVFPYHTRLDQLEEEARGENKIGTTSRGIGPAYTDKVQRIGIRIGELVKPERFEKRLREVLAVKNRLLEMFGQPLIEFNELFDEYSGYAERLRPYIEPTDSIVQKAVKGGKKVLFEGAQGTLLDLDSGTYPYVTSSHPVAGGACLGTGIGPRHIDSVLGVVKAYATRVGEGPFPTELLDGNGERLRKQGHEFGTTTGRPRRCGWLDLNIVSQSVAINSLSGIIVTRLDVLDGFESLQVAVDYEIDGQKLGRSPASLDEWTRVRPVYETVPGWQGPTSNAKSLDDLPPEARAYLDLIESRTEAPVAIVSVGPERSETITVDRSLLWG